MGSLWRAGWTVKNPHCAAAYVAFLQFPESVAFGTSLVYLSQSYIHKIVAINEVSVESFPILEFNQL